MSKNVFFEKKSSMVINKMFYRQRRPNLRRNLDHLRLRSAKYKYFLGDRRWKQKINRLYYVHSNSWCPSL